MMVGLDQSGVTETLDFMLHKYSPDVQQRLVNVGSALLLSLTTPLFIF